MKHNPHISEEYTTILFLMLFVCDHANFQFKILKLWCQLSMVEIIIN